MSANELLNVLVSERFAAEIRPRLTVPVDLVTYRDDGDPSLPAKLRQADVFISSMFRKEWTAPGMPLRLVQGVGAGTDGIDFAAIPAGCTVCNVYGHAWSVAEYVFMTMAMLNREVVAQDAALRQGGWGGGVMRIGLAGRRLLVLGLGHIGGEVARWGNFLEMEVHGLTRSPSAARAAELNLAGIGALDQLHDHLPEADFVVVAIPHTAGTTGFVDAGALARMKPAAFLINVARGPVVDEDALYEALRSRRIAGAAIDVWYSYPSSLDKPHPPAARPFHELDNVIMTPHNSGTTVQTMAYRFDFMAANIARLAAGEPLHNVVHP